VSSVRFRSAIRSSSAWLAAFAFLGVMALGYSALSLAEQLRYNAVLLADRQSELAARILATAITRDMRGAQINVLGGAELKSVRFDSPLDLEEVVAKAFARYPYPECFFAWSAVSPRVFLFVRTDREVPWARPQPPTTPYAVETVRNARVERALQERVSPQTDRGRLYSAFELSLDGTTYQGVAIAIYHDSAHERLDRVLGFIVNGRWVRDHYFSELITQTAQLAARSPNIDFVLRDERGIVVAQGGGPSQYPGSANQQFSSTFFDPALAPFGGQSAETAAPLWTLTVSAGGDAFVVASIRSSRQAVILSVWGAATLLAGLIVALLASRKHVELEALRWDFVSSMTHELKSPLSTIRAIGEMLAENQTRAKVDVKRYGELLVEQGHRLTRLVTNILTYSRVTDTTEVYSFQRLQVDELVEEALESFRHITDREHLRIDIQLCQGLPAIRADRTAMVLALDNAIDNAIRHGSAAGWIRIAAFSDGSDVMIEVADGGSGIPADELAGVQRRFVRGRSTRGEGIGLGLAIIHRIAVDHKAILLLKSRVGSGTTLTLRIPSWQA
jgi:signal transduction histidine kinase